MFKFALKRQSTQTNLKSPKMLSEETTINDETINISEFPLLYTTPERAKIQPTLADDKAIERVKSVMQIQANASEKSPIDMSFASIKPSYYEPDQTIINEKEYTMPLAYMNQISNSPLCSTAIIGSCCSCCNSIVSRLEETCACDKSTEQFHSVNGSFFDFDRHEMDTLDLFYVCFESFQATDASQMSLNYSELVKLIYAKGDVYLVQNVATDRRGYVPKTVISNLTRPWISNKPINV